LRFSGKGHSLFFQEKAMRPASITRLAPDRSNAATVVSKAVVRAAAALGLSNTGLAKVLGLSPASASRLRDGTYVLPLDSKPYEFALLLIRLFRGLDAMMGGEERASYSWMQTPNRALDGAPIDRITTITGLVETVAYVDATRARV
jgi:hypothetical protein